MKRGMYVLLAAMLSAGAAVQAHEGDAEGRAMQFHALVTQMDRQLGVAAGAGDTAAGRSALALHGELARKALLVLREAADRSPCVMMETNRPAQQAACLVDTEARLRMTDQLLEQLLRRQVLVDSAALPGG